MGQRRSFVPWLLILLSIAIAFLSSPTSSLTPDGEVLLELKEAFNDTVGALWSWHGSDPNPCAWVGITCYLPDLRVSSINLPHMQLKGFISPSIGKLQGLQRLALHQNSLHGPIPLEIKNCTELRALYLRANYLQGSIPSEIGDHLFHLSILDLSSNLLTGNIPDTLGRLSNLRFLNLSNNYFSGQIPDVGVLSTFKSMSFMGNVELCGLQIRKICRGSLGFPAVLPHSGDDSSSQGLPPIQTRSAPHFVNGVLIGAMSTMVLAIVAIFGFFWACLLSRKVNRGERYVKVGKQHLQEIETKFLSFHGNLPYSSQEVIKKLELLDEDDLVGSGGFGTVYKMVMDDNVAFAVKRIDWSRGGCDEVLEKELKVLGSIKHINLVNLRGYCRFPSAKLLICDFLELDSLHKYLHENGQEDQPLNWNARMKIALGSARGLAYLHHDCSPAIVHRNIKSSNILLDKSLEPHISDFGLAKLLAENDTNITTVVAGSFGYLAPEYLNSGHATEKSDVYSLGVLLLELITGKRPTDESFVKKGLNIVGWLNTTCGDQRIEDIVDDRCGEVEVEAVEAVLDIAAMCTDAYPECRPTMNQVLQMLEDEVLSPCPNDFYDSRLDI